jgi:hypothetical protein
MVNLGQTLLTPDFILVGLLEGVREVVRNETNGRLLHEETHETFASALKWLADLPSTKFQALQQGALETAQEFSMSQTAAQAIACYETLRKQAFVERYEEFEQWQRTLHLIEAEWDIVKGIAESAGAAIFHKRSSLHSEALPNQHQDSYHTVL